MKRAMTTNSPDPQSPDPTLWERANATQLSVIVDAADYFRHARSAMLQAKKRIMLIGWDFDARIKLDPGEAHAGEPDTIGEFIYWLAERTPALEVYLLRWDVGALKTFFRGTTLLTLLKWLRQPRIATKLDHMHPTGASHHQKIVVIDDCFAFCGGIDMTAGRWDTREHRYRDSRRIGADGRIYMPWHDATTAIQGPAARTLGELARERWRHSGAGDLAPVEDECEVWPEGLAADFHDVEIGIARTRPPMPDQTEAREIEALFVAQIASARDHIYAESQYFASRRIAEAIAARLAEPDGPEIVLINPLTAQGWLEPLAMDTARARIVSALALRDPHRRFRVYHPYNDGGEPIYVHAKVMIVDGRILRIGSANMNNRSMGLDTECDVTLAGEPGDAVASRIAAIRDELIGEHLAADPAAIGESIVAHGLIATIEAFRGDGHTLVPYYVPDMNAVETWLADNEVLDPEDPAEMFEATKKRGLFRRMLRRPARWGTG
jgi:phosphatidylserine/phosphatidylglycerophosphate/cardiolipin synthase-like enzyme